MDGVQISYELAVPLDQLPAATPFETGADLVRLLGIVGGLGQFQDDKPRKVDWRLVKSIDGTATLRSHSEPDVISDSSWSRPDPVLWRRPVAICSSVRSRDLR